jgi:hypothetical protein
MSRLIGLLYFAAPGYYFGKLGMDRQLWEKAAELHDRWVLHVAGLARKELGDGS